MTKAGTDSSSIATSVQTSAAPRLHYIDGLRAVAMLSVLLFHCAFYSDGWRVPGNMLGFLAFGYTGVNLFLVLSGFCLYWPFVKQSARKEPTLWEFAKKRCRRILPPYYVALGIFWAFLLLDVVTHHHFHEDATSVGHVVKSFFWHAAMVHNLRPEYIVSINGPFWSLALEFSLYILFPLLVEAFRRFGPLRPTLVVLALDVAYRYWVATECLSKGLSEQEIYVLCYSLFGRCFEFAAGMAAAYCVVRQTQASQKFFMGLFIASGVAAISVTRTMGNFSTFPDALWGVCFASLIVFTALPNRLSNVLSHPWLVRLGICSYSVYLIHQPIVKLLDKVGMHFHIPPLLLGLGVIVPFTLALGYVFHLFFEKPYMTPAKPKSPVVYSGSAQELPAITAD